jgi:alcohol dehydrogenase class IV
LSGGVGWVSAGFDYVPHPISVLRYGRNRLTQVPDLLTQLGLRRIFMITSPTVRRHEFLRRLTEALGDRVAGVFDRVRPHSPIETVEEAAEQVADLDAEGLLSLGGGSCVDTAKAVAYFHRQRRATQLPHVAVPTTLSGAEFSGGAGISHGSIKKIYRPNLFCDAVVLDPDVALTTPRDLFLASGLNAIAHCVEGVCSVQSTPFSDAFLLQALGLLSESLVQVRQSDADVNARGRAQVGGALAAMGSHNLPVGLEHALAHAVGAHSRAPHALVHAVLIAPVMRFNHESVVAAQAAIADALGVKGSGDLTSRARQGIDKIEQLLVDLGIPTGLHALGVREDSLEEIADAAQDDPCFPTNPRRVQRREEVVDVLRDAM